MVLSGTTKRHSGRRLPTMGAVTASLLLGSVLAMVAGAPAHAANTAYEVLIDHDGDPSTVEVREFAGRDRYDTAVRLAINFAAAKGGAGHVPVAFVASGESLVDSISAAGLAGYRDAPILLTASDELPAAVAGFIQHYEVDEVHVLGGTAAISDDVVDELESLEQRPLVKRIAGADRYATAVEASARIKASSSWCESDEKGAVLINGASDALGFGVAIQATAYRLQLPVLMTAARELPEATADYIADNRIEHVQIIGGTATVSTSIMTALAELGVDTVDRTSGASAAEVSVKLAELANGSCHSDLMPVAADRVVLVRGNADGVAAAPVLAASLADDELVTPLVVGGAEAAESLPESVRDHLAATPQYIGTETLNLGIVAIGGTAAISETVMSAAIDAAASAGTLTAVIGASTDTNGDLVIDADDPIRHGDTGFALYFSDPVAFSPAVGSEVDRDVLNKLQDIVEINGVPTVLSSVTAPSGIGVCGPRVLNVTFASPVRAGDTISIAASELMFGAGDDKRLLAAVTPETVVRGSPPDRTRPTARMIAIEHDDPSSNTQFTIEFNDVGGLPEPVRLAAAVNDAAIVGDLVLTPAGGAEAAEVTAVNSHSSNRVTVELNRPVVAGDRLTLKAGSVADLAGNTNVRATGIAIAAQPRPRIVSVLMSPPRHIGHARWQVPGWLGVGELNDPDAVRIEAKAGGDAAGVEGNSWTFRFSTSSSWSPDADLDIDVAVDTGRKQVHVRFVNGRPTVGDLFAAFRATGEFDARFTASSCAHPTRLLTPDTSTLSLGGRAFFLDADNHRTTWGIGRTQFAIEVSFNAFISQVGHEALLADVLGATILRNTPTGAIPPTVAELTGPDGLDVVLAVSDSPVDVYVGQLEFLLDRPTNRVRYEATASDAAHMPRARDLVLTHAVTTSDLGVITIDPVAQGYATDNVNTAVFEQYNAFSRTRIAVSPRVAPPPPPS